MKSSKVNFMIAQDLKIGLTYELNANLERIDQMIWPVGCFKNCPSLLDLRVDEINAWLWHRF